MRAMVGAAGVSMRRWPCGRLQPQCGEDLRPVSLFCAVAQPLRVNDRLQIEECRLEQGIDYNEVEVARLGDLDAGVGQPLLDRLGGVLTAALEALAQLFPARREHRS